MANNDNKTQPTKVSPAAFLARKASDQQLADCRELSKLFRALTGKPAKMWGPSIVGFGTYHYVYPSGREGDSPLIGFSPRGAEIVIYLATDLDDRQLRAKLGKHRAGSGCLYIKRLSDIDRGVLEKIARMSITELRKRYP